MFPDTRAGRSAGRRRARRPGFACNSIVDRRLHRRHRAVGRRQVAAEQERVGPDHLVEPFADRHLVALADARRSETSGSRRPPAPRSRRRSGPASGSGCRPRAVPRRRRTHRQSGSSSRARRPTKIGMARNRPTRMSDMPIIDPVRDGSSLRRNMIVRTPAMTSAEAGERGGPSRRMPPDVDGARRTASAGSSDAACRAGIEGGEQGSRPFPRRRRRLRFPRQLGRTNRLRFRKADVQLVAELVDRQVGEPDAERDAGQRPRARRGSSPRR